MNERVEDRRVVAVDGREWRVTLPDEIAAPPGLALPDALGQALGLRPAEGYSLVPLGREGRLLGLARRAVAAAGPVPSDPRQDRLRMERLRLEQMNRESDYCRAEPRDVLNGSEPEHYVVTFRCRGIVGLDGQRPVYGEFHQVEMWLDEEFPSQVPRLRWLTDIWHPNIQHDGAKGVCVNRHEWLAGMGLDDLCRQLFEMVQYKNYHADDAPPFPLDRSAATWVKSIAEPQGIVDKRRNLAVDNKPFTRPTVPSTITVVTPEAPVTPSRIRILPKAPAAPAAPSRIRLVAATPAPPAPAPSAPRIRLSQPVP